MQVGTVEMDIISSDGSNWTSNDYSVLYIFTARLTKPITRTELSEIIGKNIEIGGRLHKIRGVESFAAENQPAGWLVDLITEQLEKPF